MVLRAELSHDQREIVAHTTELTPASAVVRTDESLSPGDVVSLRLSLRQLLPPLQLTARVVALDPGSGLGYFPGVTLAFENATPEQQAYLTRLVGKIEEGSAEPPVCRILVVEDSQLMREHVETRAERVTGDGVRVIVDTADSVERALELLSTRSYALALVDLFLPDKSGDGLVRTIRDRGLDQLAVIGCSVGGSAARTAFLEAGADLYLDKPVKVKDLFATVQRLTLLNARKGSP
ncbi:MAG TPA: response regulator [Kofleriaceae bacterium]|nr:response regulator [Kofleriaceae bacterium]